MPADILDPKVSSKAAHDMYGVVIDSAGRLDHPATGPGRVIPTRTQVQATVEHGRICVLDV